jgi:hypothetical protein
MECSTSELGVRLLQYFDRVLAAVNPIMIVGDDLGVSKPIVVHQSPQRSSDVRFLGGAEDASRVRGIGVLGLVLNPNCVRDYPLVPEPLQRFQEVHSH